MAKNKLGITPLSDRVVIRPQKEIEEKTKGGIIIPDTASKEKPERGVVAAVGAGRIDENGNRIPMSVSVGDTVLFSKYTPDETPDEITIDGQKYMILGESHILAIVE